MDNETITTPPKDADTDIPAPDVATSRFGVWAATAALCVLLAVGCSLLVAHALAGHEEAKARSDFHATSSAVASTLSSAIRREDDLRVATSTFFAGDPTATSGQFAAWAGWARVLARHPELRRLGLISAVKASRLRSFAVRMGMHANGASRPRQAARELHVTPSGARAEYCLTAGEIASGAVLPEPHGLDYCAREKRLLASRGSGETLESARAGRGVWEAQIPVYSGNATPASASARNAKFVGWVRQVIAPGVLVDEALSGHPGYSARLRYGSGPADIASAGVPRSGAQMTNVSIARGWSLTSFGPTAAAPLLANGRIWVLIVGLALGVLLSLAVLLLERRKAAQSFATVAAPSPEPATAVAEPLYDPLTGLPGHALTLDRAALVIARARRHSGLLSGVLLIDIDWFKDVNDKLGNEAGDQLLRIVAQRLQGAMRVEDTIGRLGADRFAVLVECTARDLRPDALAQRVLETLHQPLELDGFGPSFSMTASIGVAFGRYESTDELLKDGDTALQAAKSDGKGCYRLFDASTHAVIEGRSSLEAALATAVQQRALQLLYEPIQDLQARRVIGFEAKPFWSDAERGQMATDELQRLAEDCGLTVPLDRWALEEACARAAAWEVEGVSSGVSVKVGSQQLHRDGLITDIRRALQQSGVQPERLTIAVAESAVMGDVATAAERLDEIKRLGVRLAIDDFGDGGYAYHSDLRRLPIDCLRVERGSLAASGDPDYRNWLFEAIVMVGRELSLTVVAKDVQSEQDLEELQAMGCEVAQGPCLGEPVAAAAAADVVGSVVVG